MCPFHTFPDYSAGIQAHDVITMERGQGINTALVSDVVQLDLAILRVRLVVIVAVHWKVIIALFSGTL